MYLGELVEYAQRRALFGNPQAAADQGLRQWCVRLVAHRVRRFASAGRAGGGRPRWPAAPRRSRRLLGCSSNSARIRASEDAHAGRPSPGARSGSPGLAGRRPAARTAFVVRVRNRGTAAGVSDLPISVGVPRRDGTRRSTSTPIDARVLLLRRPSAADRRRADAHLGLHDRLVACRRGRRPFAIVGAAAVVHASRGHTLPVIRGPRAAPSGRQPSAAHVAAVGRACTTSSSSPAVPAAGVRRRPAGGAATSRPAA